MLSFEDKRVRTLSWICYVVGIAIVALGYLQVVSQGTSWIGWGIAMFGWALQYLPKKQKPMSKKAQKRAARRRRR